MSDHARSDRCSVSRFKEPVFWFEATFVALIFLFVFLLATVPASADISEPETTSCESCHSSSEWFEGELIEIADLFSNDVHRAVGLGCHDCHGGNPDVAFADDMFAAMDEEWQDNPYRGSPDTAELPEFCGRCHSDPSFMRTYNPGPRVDQLSEYWSSRHGIALKQGDTGVATCADCHGVHGVRRIDDPESRVHPKNLHKTCGGCHSDPERMRGRTDSHGLPMRVDQAARWERSVHANAMFARGDLTAPTCNDCHGNHGATPPGIESVSFVCGQCHGRETELFRASAKHVAFSDHNDYLEVAEDGCADCHEDPGPVMKTTARFSECATCHDNHAVVRPTVALLGQLPPTPCAFCHDPRLGGGSVVSESDEVVENFANVRDSLLVEAAGEGLDGNARFDWLVDRALELPFHTFPAREDGVVRLRPEFERLFQKFRIGKTHFSYVDPATGETVVEGVRQCTGCHSDLEGVGLATARAQLDAIWDLTTAIARSERILLAAQRGGVETRSAHADLDGAIDAAIELEVLVHSFVLEGEFSETLAEGSAFADSTLEAGQNALDELAFRRRGLLVALGIVMIVLIALAMKIRALPEE